MGSEFSSQSGANYKLLEKIDMPAGLSPGSAQWALYKAVSCSDRCDVSVFVYSLMSTDKQDRGHADCLKRAENCAKVCKLVYCVIRPYDTHEDVQKGNQEATVVLT
jgi:hypothetical protein